MLRWGRGCFYELRVVTGNCRREGLIDGLTGGIDSTLRAQGQMLQLGGEETERGVLTGHTLPGLYFANTKGESSCSQTPSL